VRTPLLHVSVKSLTFFVPLALLATSIAASLRLQALRSRLLPAFSTALKPSITGAPAAILKSYLMERRYCQPLPAKPK
jgi:hypothetical protein